MTFAGLNVPVLAVKLTAELIVAPGGAAVIAAAPEVIVSELTSLPEDQRSAVGREAGLMVVSLVAGAPAAAAGVIQGDILLELDGAPVTELSAVRAALDEGRIFSGDSHIEEFLRTTVERLAAPGAPKGQGPKLLLFGRPAAQRFRY